MSKAHRKLYSYRSFKTITDEISSNRQISCNSLSQGSDKIYLTLFLSNNYKRDPLIISKVFIKLSKTSLKSNKFHINYSLETMLAYEVCQISSVMVLHMTFQCARFKTLCISLIINYDDLLILSVLSRKSGHSVSFPDATAWQT